MWQYLVVKCGFSVCLVVSNSLIAIMDPWYHVREPAAQQQFLYSDGNTVYNLQALTPSVSMPTYSAFGQPPPYTQPVYCLAPTVTQVYQPVGYHGYGMPVSAPYQPSVLYQPGKNSF